MFSLNNFTDFDDAIFLLSILIERLTVILLEIIKNKLDGYIWSFDSCCGNFVERHSFRIVSGSFIK